MVTIGAASCHKHEEECEDYRNKWIGEYSYKALIVCDTIPSSEQIENFLCVEKVGPTEVNIIIYKPWYESEQSKFTFTVWPNGDLHLINEFDTRRFVKGGFAGDSLVFSYRDVDIITHYIIDYDFHCLKK